MTNSKFKNTKDSAFTLVEMSVVLIIIALIVGGIASGKSLIENAKIVKTIKEVEEIKKATVLFEETYHAKPGDMTNAGEILGCPNDPDNPPSWDGVRCNSGNGDGYIDSLALDGNLAGPATSTPLAHESIIAWYYLAHKGFIQGGYTGQYIGNNVNTIPYMSPSVNIPASSILGGGYNFGVSRGILPNTGTNYDAYDSAQRSAFGVQFGSNAVSLGKVSLGVGSQVFGVGVVNQFIAQKIDIKSDDGVANTGMVYAVNGHGSPAGSCSDRASTTNGANYTWNVAFQNLNHCLMIFWINKECSSARENC